MGFKREGMVLSEHLKCAAKLYTVGLKVESSLYSHKSETTMFSFEKNILMFFSNETFSLPSKQEMLIFCSTATASLYRRGINLWPLLLPNLALVPVVAPGEG